MHWSMFFIAFARTLHTIISKLTQWSTEVHSSLPKSSTVSGSTSPLTNCTYHFTTSEIIHQCIDKPLHPHHQQLHFYTHLLHSPPYRHQNAPEHLHRHPGNTNDAVKNWLTTCTSSIAFNLQYFSELCSTRKLLFRLEMIISTDGQHCQTIGQCF